MVTVPVSSAPHVTAEWQCTRCNTTTRKLVGALITRTVDRCVSCHRKHEITRADRPVRWNARAL
jgi:DNA-directed RNA polymerase subunit RPC12/RpoP